MDASRLKALQAPIKERYKKDPAAAVVTLRAQGRIGEGIACRVDTGKALIEAGLHPATGGTGLQACSGDMLLEALVACAGVTLKAVATALAIDLKDAERAAEIEVAFREIRLKLDLDCDAPEEQVKKLIELTERYCVVMQTIRSAAPVRASL